MTKLIIILTAEQKMHCYSEDKLLHSFIVSTAKKGLGELNGSECTPRGWHRIYSRIGLTAEINSVFVGREWTGEIYSKELATQYPERDWILTRILQLEGIEPERNKGGNVDSLKRFIYIHGTPDSTILGEPGSHGCVRVRNCEMVQLADWVEVGTLIYIV